VDFKVEMGRVDAVIVPDGADLFSLVDLLPLAHLNPVEVGVKGVREFQLPVLAWLVNLADLFSNIQ